MSCIIDENNYEEFEVNGINTIIPRSVKWESRLDFLMNGHWVALGFKEAKWLTTNIIPNEKIRVCIDQANGHMTKLLNLCKELKDKYGERIRIMTGNIANPYSYREYARVGVDYVRVGIGGGAGCTTSVQTGIHYPMGSLITKCKVEKDFVIKSIELGAKYRSVPKIVADGGFKYIDQIVKALALGSDYVMLGGILGKTRESCGKEWYVDSLGKKHTITGGLYPTHKEYYGMSTEKAQRQINESSLYKEEYFVPKHSEGIVKFIPIEYSIKEWTSDFDHALRSCMSYVGARDLNEFRGHVKWDTMTDSSFKSYIK
jgi:IMP dehydrogenase/GMP reductase